MLKGMLSLCRGAAAGIIYIKYHQNYLTANHKGTVKSMRACVCVGFKPHTRTVSLAYVSLMCVALAAVTASRPWVCLTKNWVCVHVRACMYLCVCV